MQEATRWISSALAHWAVVVLRYARTTIVLLLALGSGGLYYAAGNLGINTDTADMISASLPWRRHFIDFREAFPVRDRNIVVVVDAATPAQAERYAERLAAELRARPGAYRSVFLAGSGAFFDRNGLLYLGVDELEALSDRLVAAQPLLGLLAQRFNGAGVVEVVERAVEERGGDAAELAPLYGELAGTLEDAAESSDIEPLAWHRLIGTAASDASRRLVIVQPVLDFTRVQPAGAAIERLRELVDAELVEGGGDVTVRLTGTIAMEHEEILSVSRGAGLAGLAALAMVALVLYWALRSLRLLVASLVTLIVGLGCTAAFAALAVGQLNLLSVAFAVLYVGLGVDFILHINLRFKELLAEGAARAAAIVETMRGVGTSLVICAVTTAAGFYSFIPTPFDGVSELGLISGTGMFVSLAVSVTLLPALLAVLPERAFRGSAGPPARRPWAPLSRHPRVVVLVCVVLMLATFGSLPWVRFDSNPVNLRDPESESVRVLRELASESEAPLLNLVAIAGDAATAREWAHALEALPEVREVNTVEELVPERQQEKLFVLEDLELVLGPGFADFEAEPERPDALAAALAELEATLAALPEAAATERRLLAAVRELDARLDALEAGAARARLVELGRALAAELPRELERLEAALQAETFGREALPDVLAERWLTPAGRELVEIVPAEDVGDDAAATRFVEAVRGVVPSATGLPVVHQEASETVVRSFRLALTYAFALVVVILLVLLRKASDILHVIVPIVFAAGATAGLTVWLGIPFNFANIIALPLLVGVGVDNGIHMVHRMRAAPPEDGDLLATSTSRAVLASGLTTIASFGNLAWSAHLGMASMGQLLTLGMTVTLLATLVLLPALLAIRSIR